MTATDALTPDQAANLLHSAIDVIRAELTAAPIAVLRWRPAPGEWCALEVIGHLIEAEQRGFAGRIRQILARPGLTLTAWDQAAVAAARRDDARDPYDLLGELAGLRGSAIELVRGLDAADLERCGEHPTVGRLAIRDLLHEWVHHDRNHIRQMMANVQTRVWPHMGHAQRFSASAG